jgi:hypothetical protein
MGRDPTAVVAAPPLVGGRAPAGEGQAATGRAGQKGVTGRHGAVAESGRHGERAEWRYRRLGPFPAVSSDFYHFYQAVAKWCVVITLVLFVC